MKNRKTKTNVRIIEMVADPSLARQNAKASKVLKRFFPDARGLQLYRTAEGEIGIQIDLVTKSGRSRSFGQSLRRNLEGACISLAIFGLKKTG